MSRVKNELRNLKRRGDHIPQVNKTDPSTLTAGFRRIVINKGLNALMVDINDKGVSKCREYRMQKSRFLIIDQKSIIANHSPTGPYIHMDSVLDFIAHNCFGFEAGENKVIVPKKEIIIPG